MTTLFIHAPDRRVKHGAKSFEAILEDGIGEVTCPHKGYHLQSQSYRYCAFSYRYKCFVVEECTFDRFELSHLVSLFDMNAKYADVISLEEALKHITELETTAQYAKNAVTTIESEVVITK